MATPSRNQKRRGSAPPMSIATPGGEGAEGGVGPSPRRGSLPKMPLSAVRAS